MTEGDVAERDAPVIPDDVPCAGCGYNLRGLPADGACPECGHDRLASIDAELARRRGHWPVDPAWARQVVEGVYALFASLALALATAASPGAMFVRRAPGRYLVVSMLAAGWVASWYGAWKLTSPEPRMPLTPWAGRSLVLARWVRTVFFLIPVIWMIEISWPSLRRFEPPFTEGLWLYAGPGSGVAVGLVFGVLASRVGRRRLAVEAAAFAIACGFVTLMAHPGIWRGVGPGSVELMAQLPAPPFTSLNVVWKLAGRTPLNPVSLAPQPLPFVMALTPLWACAILARLLLAYRPFAGAGRGVAVRSTPGSAGPA